MKSIKPMVNKLIKKYGTNCPFELARHLGIVVVFEPLGGTLGYYSKHFRIPIIHINQDCDNRTQLFICAHELGHALKHPDTNTPFLKKHTLFSVDKIEIEANTFAIELLLPDELFLENSSHIHDSIVNNGIPLELLTLKKLKELNE